jgi:HAE1 family hydrophobic/amphiphilic exporter-1
MGRAIIGGVITSTLLTLVVVPVIYTYLDRFAEWRKARHEARVARHAAAASAATATQFAREPAE